MNVCRLLQKYLAFGLVLFKNVNGNLFSCIWFLKTFEKKLSSRISFLYFNISFSFSFVLKFLEQNKALIITYIAEIVTQIFSQKKKTNYKIITYDFYL